MSWDKHKKPPTDVCPGRYCFNWVPPGGTADVSGHKYASFDEAISPKDGWTAFPDGGCACPFGKCSRASASPDSRDFYEPEELVLHSDGLPWFYFIASVDQVGLVESKEEYLRESTKLWHTPDNEV